MMPRLAQLMDGLDHVVIFRGVVVVKEELNSECGRCVVLWNDDLAAAATALGDQQPVLLQNF